MQPYLFLYSVSLEDVFKSGEALTPFGLNQVDRLVGDVEGGAIGRDQSLSPVRRLSPDEARSRIAIVLLHGGELYRVLDEPGPTRTAPWTRNHPAGCRVASCPRGRGRGGRRLRSSFLQPYGRRLPHVEERRATPIGDASGSQRAGTSQRGDDVGTSRCVAQPTGATDDRPGGRLRATSCDRPSCVRRALLVLAVGLAGTRDRHDDGRGEWHPGSARARGRGKSPRGTIRDGGCGR